MNQRYDQGDVQALEAVYLASRDQADLGPLYLELIRIGRIIFGAYRKKKGFSLGAVRNLEIVEDAATRLLEMYLKHPDQKTIPLSTRMYFEILYQLHNPRQKRVDQTIDIEECCPQVKRPEATERQEYIKTIVSDNRVDGKKIIVDLYRYRYYKLAILAIAKYTREEWIRLHAVELHTIFKLTRKSK